MNAKFPLHIFCDVFGIDLTLVLDFQNVLIVVSTSERVSNV